MKIIIMQIFTIDHYSRLMWNTHIHHLEHILIHGGCILHLGTLQRKDVDNGHNVFLPKNI